MSFSNLLVLAMSGSEGGKSVRALRSNVVYGCLLLCGVFAFADTPAPPLSITDQEKQIQKMAVDTSINHADKAALRNLNSLKIQLINALAQDMQQLQADAKNTTLSSASLRLNAQGIAADQNEMNSLNDSLNTWNDGVPVAGAANPPPPAPPVAKCLSTANLDSELAVPSLNAVDVGSASASGTVLKAVDGTVQVCDDKGNSLGDPGTVGAGGVFTVTLTNKATSNQKIQAQFKNKGQFSTASAPLQVGSCKTDVSSSTTKPTLHLSDPDQKGMVTYKGTAPAGSTVRICVNDIPSDDAKTVTAGADGNFDGGSNAFKIQPGDQVVAQSTAPGSTPSFGPLSDAVPITWPPSDSNGMIANIVAGVEQSGYSSLANNTGGFLNAFFRSGYIPLSKNLGLAAWGRVRLLSAPQPGTVDIASVLTDPTGKITTQSYSSIGAAIDYVVGPELKLYQWNNGTSRSRVSLVAGVGATTPLSSGTVTVSYAVPPPQTAECEQLLATYGAGSKLGPNPYLFKNPSQLSCIWNPANGTPYNFISFANQNRSNFLFKWGAGGRFTHVYAAKGNTPSYSGSLDVLVGQDSSVTGGKVSGWVFKLDGVYPMPYTGSILYVFGSAAMRFKHNQDFAPLILANATNAPTPPSDQVAVLSLTQPNRDFYRLGFGINLATIWCKFATAGCPQPAATDTNTPTPAPQPAQPAPASSGKK
jgi:hypothetical protein